MKIIFTDTVGIDEKYYAIPAIKEIPDWHKKTSPHLGEKFEVINGLPNHTIKKCMPVFDAMTMGYIIKTYTDVYVTQENGYPYYQWRSYAPIDFHQMNQGRNHPLYNGSPYPKWINPWSIKTKKGYSCLFIPPMNRENNIFTILPGVVDTDEYYSPVNLPFVLNDVKWTGLIPAGTPIAQVIPFKRNKFSIKFGNKKNIKQLEFIDKRISSIISNSYKKQFWNRKKYL